VSLRRVVAAPFLRRETDRVTHAEFIYSLTRDAEWFDTGEAEDVLKAGVDEALLETDGDELRPAFEVSEVEIPDGFSPSKRSLVGENRGVFERTVDRLVEAGHDKREAVAEINRRHAEMGDVGVQAAALVVAKEKGLRVADLAEEGLEELR